MKISWAVENLGGIVAGNAYVQNTIQSIIQENNCDIENPGKCEYFLYGREMTKVILYV